MAKSIFEYNPMFKAAAEQVRFAIEKASQEHVDIFDKCWYEGHFTMGNKPHLLSEFKTLLGKKHITIAASTINDNAAEPLRLNRGFKEVEQKMFTHAHAYKMDSDDIRQLIMAAKLAETQQDVQAVNYIRDYLFDAIKDSVNGVKARLDLIILRALSNRGIYTFTKEDDPQSPFVGVQLDFGMPSANKAEVGTGYEWYDASSKTFREDHLNTIDPLKEMDDMLGKVRYGIEKILVSRDMANYMRRTKAMKEYVYQNNYAGQAVKPLSLANMNDWLTSNGYPSIEIVERAVGVQDGDSVSEVTPWNPATMLFVPSNNFGTIETRMSDSELGIASEGVKYTNYGRIELRQLTMGEKENTSYTELTKASITAAPAIDTIDRMLTLDTSK